jgi:rRNA maturation protein Nop10
MDVQQTLDAIRRRHGNDASRRVTEALDRVLREGDRRREDDTGFPPPPRFGGEDRHRRARDAALRWADDDEGHIEELLEELLEACPELGHVIREAAEDRRSPHHWAKDRRERREAEDYRRGFRHFGDGRRISRDVSWGPYANEPSKPIENFSERRGESNREESNGLGGDRRRAAHDALAFDAGMSDYARFAAMFPGAANIITK